MLERIAENDTFDSQEMSLIIAIYEDKLTQAEKAKAILGKEVARLSEIIDYMQNRYSPLSGRGCALCVYKDGVFQRSCKLHQYADTLGAVW